MFSPPVDAFQVWVALSVVSVAALGAALSVPSAPPPDATAAANTVDAVAASPVPTVATHRVTATAIEIGPHRVGLRSSGGTAHATLTYGPVTPVEDGPLADVLRGRDPRTVFASNESFADALEAARDVPVEWRRVDGQITVRSVSWGGTRATLVGA